MPIKEASLPELPQLVLCPFPAMVSWVFSQSQCLRKDLGGFALFLSSPGDLDVSAAILSPGAPFPTNGRVVLRSVLQGFPAMPLIPGQGWVSPQLGLGAAGRLRGIPASCPASPPPRGQLARGADGEVEPGCSAGFQATIKRSDVETKYLLSEKSKQSLHLPPAFLPSRAGCTTGV